MFVKKPMHDKRGHTSDVTTDALAAAFTKVTPLEPGQQVGGLSSMLKQKPPAPTSSRHHGHTATPAIPVVLSASFRDPSMIPMPLAETITEEEDESCTDSDSDVESKSKRSEKMGRGGVHGDDDDETSKDARNERTMSRDEGGIFEGEF